MSTSLQDKLLNYITENDWVTYAELSNRFAISDRSEEGRSLWHPTFKNIMLWTDITVEACEALQNLQGTGKIHWEPTSMLTYLIDGCGLTLPLAKRARDYVNPHWLPVCWRPGPYVEKPSRTKADKRTAQ